MTAGMNPHAAHCPPPGTEPTDEQLRLAFRQISRPGWPATLEAAIAHRTFGVCLRAIACQLNRPGWGPRPNPAPPAVLPSAPPVSAGIPRRARPFSPGADLKRLAANDKD